MLVDLEVLPDTHKSANVKHYPISRSKPFLINRRAKLIHRVRSADVIKLGDRQRHYAFRAYCGNHFSGSDKDFQLTDQLVDGDIICHRCERRVAQLSLPSSDDLSGRVNLVGGVSVYSNSDDQEWL